jgi:hypothetical protein
VKAIFLRIPFDRHILMRFYTFVIGMSTLGSWQLAGQRQVNGISKQNHHPLHDFRIYQRQIRHFTEGVAYILSTCIFFFGDVILDSLP